MIPVSLALEDEEFGTVYFKPNAFQVSFHRPHEAGNLFGTVSERMDIVREAAKWYPLTCQ
jgi:hypothetical protein